MHQWLSFQMRSSVNPQNPVYRQVSLSRGRVGSGAGEGESVSRKGVVVGDTRETGAISRRRVSEEKETVICSCSELLPCYYSLKDSPVKHFIGCQTDACISCLQCKQCLIKANISTVNGHFEKPLFTKAAVLQLLSKIQYPFTLRFESSLRM